MVTKKGDDTSTKKVEKKYKLIDLVSEENPLIIGMLQYNNLLIEYFDERNKRNLMHEEDIPKTITKSDFNKKLKEYKERRI